LKTNDTVKGTRINFLHYVVTPQDTRAALVEMVRKPGWEAEQKLFIALHSVSTACRLRSA
jgi:hypothetical protein